MATHTTSPITTEDALVEVQATTGTTPAAWMALPGTSGIAESGGDAPTRETRTFAAVFTHTGNASPPSISISMNAFVPIHPTIRTIIDAHRDNDLVNFRYTLAGRVVKPSAGAGNTAAIAPNTGLVTFANTGQNAAAAGDAITDETFLREDVGPGMALKIDNDYYVISAISDMGKVTVVGPVNRGTNPAREPSFTAPSAMVAAAAFTVEQPRIRRPGFACRIMNVGNIDAQVDSDVASTVEVQPISILPQWEVF